MVSGMPKIESCEGTDRHESYVCYVQEEEDEEEGKEEEGGDDRQSSAFQFSINHLETTARGVNRSATISRV